MKDQKVVKVECKSEFAIVRKIAEVLVVGDTGKLDGLMNKTIKFLKRENKALSHNLESENHNKEMRLSDLNDSLEDAKTGFKEAFMAIDINKLSTHADQTAEVKPYLAQLDAAEAVIDGIEEDIKEATEQFGEKIKSIEDDIKANKSRIKQISE